MNNLEIIMQKILLERKGIKYAGQFMGEDVVEWELAEKNISLK